MVKVEEYIRKLVKGGYSRSHIIEQLVEAGYEENDVSPMIDAAQEEFYPGDTSKRWHFVAAVVSVIIVISGVLLFLSYQTAPALCEDTGCITAAANACQPAQYYENIEGTMMLYEVRGCQLTKRFTSFGPKEPKELQDLLKEKTIECPYEQGRFDASWLEVFGSMETCTGDLKDAVLQVRLAQTNLG